MNRTTIYFLIVTIVISGVFYRKLVVLEDEKSDLIALVESLENDNRQTRLGKSTIDAGEISCDTNEKKTLVVKSEESIDIVRENVDQSTSLDNSPEKNDSMENISSIFLEEQTDYSWAIPFENNIGKLFHDSEKMANMGFISSECRTSSCKVLFTRSYKGALVDAGTFLNEFSNKAWSEHTGFSFEFGKEGHEEYVTIWIKR
jgi:hypothetical protein